MSTSSILVRVYAVCALIAIITFLSAHGGAGGDFDRELINTDDPHSKNPHAPTLIFNRWQMRQFNSEPMIYQFFILLLTPANLAARLIYKALKVLPEFDDPFPFGLSYPTYIMLLLLAFGGVQWYLIGLLFDRLLRKWKKTWRA